MQRIDTEFRRLTEACFTKYGRGYGELLANWPAIVGEALAANTRPERLRRASAPGVTGGAGTLLVRVREGHALAVQHEVGRIVERINGYFGYEVVRSLKVMQGPLPPRKTAGRAPLEPAPAARTTVEAAVAPLDDERLRQALGRLGCSIAAANTTR